MLNANVGVTSELTALAIRNYGKLCALCKKIKMIKEAVSNQPCGRDSECKMVRFRRPSYIYPRFKRSFSLLCYNC